VVARAGGSSSTKHHGFPDPLVVEALRPRQHEPVARNGVPDNEAKSA
jgi:hypothetical protein